jgi:KaiC/GvpD/RAD55 family RecA-like ATPase
MPQISLIEDLTTTPIPPGSNILVEFDASSQWYNACVTILAGWLNTGGRVTYLLSARPPENFRSQLRRFGLDSGELEAKDRLQIWDFYSATLGQKSKERYGFDSLKVADLSITISRGQMHREPSPNHMYITENSSVLTRFNDEKSTVEYLLTRALPAATITKSTSVRGIITGVHSDSVYNQLEAAADGVIDLKVEEVVGEARNLIRIRKMLNAPYDARWYKLKVDSNFAVTLEK